MPSGLADTPVPRVHGMTADGRRLPAHHGGQLLGDTDIAAPEVDERERLVTGAGHRIHAQGGQDNPGAHEGFPQRPHDFFGRPHTCLHVHAEFVIRNTAWRARL